MSIAKERSRFVSAAMRSNAVANAAKHEWAREQQERAVAAAGDWVGRSDDALWEMVTAQELPRTVYTNEGVNYKGQQPYCPGCGEEAPAKSGREWWGVRRCQAVEDLVRTLQGSLSEKRLRGFLRDCPGRARDVQT